MKSKLLLLALFGLLLSACGSECPAVQKTAGVMSDFVGAVDNVGEWLMYEGT